MGVEMGWCVEFGAWDEVKLSNTWDLWHNKGWSALLIEADTKKFSDLKKYVSEFPKVTPLEAFADSQGGKLPRPSTWQNKRPG